MIPHQETARGRRPSLSKGGNMSSTLAQNVFQIGFVVPDIHKGIAFFKDKFGVRNFCSSRSRNFRTRLSGTAAASPGFRRVRRNRGRAHSAHRGRQHLFEISRPTIRRAAGTITASKYPTTVRACGTWRRADLRSCKAATTTKQDSPIFDTTGTIGPLTEIVYLQPEEKASMHSLKHKKWRAFGTMLRHGAAAASGRCCII